MSGDASGLGALLQAGGELPERGAQVGHGSPDRAEGTRRLYRLDDEGIAAVREYLEDVWGEAAARFRLLAENTSERTGRDTP
jgi:hypothetical protein